LSCGLSELALNEYWKDLGIQVIHGGFIQSIKPQYELVMNFGSMV
jgi:hypothetical protein